MATGAAAETACGLSVTAHTVGLSSASQCAQGHGHCLVESSPTVQWRGSGGSAARRLGEGGAGRGGDGTASLAMTRRVYCAGAARSVTSAPGESASCEKAAPALAQLRWHRAAPHSQHTADRSATDWPWDSGERCSRRPIQHSQLSVTSGYHVTARHVTARHGTARHRA